MSGNELSGLIDRIAARLASHLREDAADAIATELAGEITSRYYVIEKPADEDVTRAELEAMGIPGLRASS